MAAPEGMNAHVGSTLTVRIPVVPDACLSPNARSGTSRWNRSKAVAALREATAVAVRQAIGSGGADPNFFLGCAAVARGWAAMAIDWHVAWPRDRRRKDDDAIPLMVKAARDQIADEIAVNDRRMRTGRVTQSQDPDGLGWIEATLRIEEAETA